VRGEARRRRAPGTAPLHEPADADQSAPELHAAGGGRESPPAKGAGGRRSDFASGTRLDGSWA